VVTDTCVGAVLASCVGVCQVAAVAPVAVGTCPTLGAAEADTTTAPVAVLSEPATCGSASTPVRPVTLSSSVPPSAWLELCETGGRLST
jgi:hypothetical protein